MWDMLLAFLRSYPQAAAKVNWPKAVLPRLWSLLRHGCYGSATTSLPALLPLLTLLPKQLLQLQPNSQQQQQQEQKEQQGQKQQQVLVLEQLVRSCWEGLGHCTGQAPKAATAQAIVECLGWGVRNAKEICGGKEVAAAAVVAVGAGEGGDGGMAEQYCRLLLGGWFANTCLPLALGSSSSSSGTSVNATAAAAGGVGVGGDSGLAMVVVDGLLQQCCSAPAAAGANQTGAGQARLPLQLQVLLSVLLPVIEGDLRASLAGRRTRGGQVVTSNGQQQEEEGEEEKGQEGGGVAAILEASSSKGSSSSSEETFDKVKQILIGVSGFKAGFSAAAAGAIGACCVRVLMVEAAAEGRGDVYDTAAAATAAASGGLAGIEQQQQQWSMPLGALELLAEAFGAMKAAAAAESSAEGLALAEQYLSVLVTLALAAMRSETTAAATAAAAVHAVLACIGAAADSATAWEQVLQQLQGVAATGAGATAAAGSGAVAAIELATKLLQAAATAAAAAAGGVGGAGVISGEPCQGCAVLVGKLDQWACKLALGLQQQAAGPAAESSSSSAAAGVAVAAEARAAAELLGCCLGANDSRQLLLTAAVGQQVLEVLLQGFRGYVLGFSKGGLGAVAAAGAIVLVLERLLSTINAATASDNDGVTASSESSATAWQLLCEDYSRQLSQLLLLVYQLSWGSSSELKAAAAAAGGDDGSSDDESSSSSVISYGTSDDDDEVTAAAGGAGDEDGRGGVVVGGGREVVKEQQKVQDAAERVWMAAGASGAIGGLEGDNRRQLVQQVQQLLVDGLGEAAATAAGATGGQALEEQGCRWAYRAATAVGALTQQQQQPWQQSQQQLQADELLSALLSTGGLTWCQYTQHHNTTSSSSSSGSSGQVYESSLMVEFAAALVLQVGAARMLQLPVANGSTSGSSSSSGSSCWLALELLCQHQAAVAAGEESEALAVAAASLQSQMVSRAVTAAAAAAADGADSPAPVASKQLLYLIVDLLQGACQSAATASASASDVDGGEGAGLGRAGVYSKALVSLLKAVADRSKARPQLLQLLQVFFSQGIAAPLIGKDASSSSSGSSSGLVETVAGRFGDVQVSGELLLQVLPVCATALRRVSVEAVAAARVDVLAVHLGRQALELQPGSTTGSSTAVLLLRQVLSCFPVSVQISLPHGATAAGGGGGGAAAEPSSSSGTSGSTGGPLAAGACTAAERQVLMALLRHYGGTTPAAAGGSSTGTLPAAAGGDDGLGLMSQLQLICTAYCWSDMAAAEWHAVLRDIQQYISAARAEMQRLSGRLAAIICTAAQQLLGSTTAADGSTAVMSPDTAAALLFKLSAKGLLQKHPAYSQLLISQREALTAFKLPATALPSLQLLAAVLQLQPEIQAGGRAPQLQLALSSSQGEVAAMFLAVGAALAVASTAGAAAVAPVLTCMDQSATAWQALASCLSYADDEAKMAALTAADARSAMVGVDGVGCLLALLRCPAAATARSHPHHHHHHQHHHQQQQQQPAADGLAAGDDSAFHAGYTLEVLEGLAWQLLLNPRCLSIISYVAAAAAGSGSSDDVQSSSSAAAVGGGELPEFDVDVEGYLTAVGLRPEMAAGLAHAKPWAPHLLQWALLLAHLQTLQQQQQLEAARRLSQALREVPELVPLLLDRVVSLMPLTPGSSSRGKLQGGSTAAAGGGSTAAVQLAVQLQQLGGEGPDWQLQQLLSRVGLPVTHSQWQLVAAGVYRAVLWLLPASARLWFGDLRDKARAAAVEGYTVRFESPALLAAEFGAIRRGSSSSGDNFKVRANAGTREVVAVLEIEDGATLELLVKLPAAAPLKVAEVECRNKVRGGGGWGMRWTVVHGWCGNGVPGI